MLQHVWERASQARYLTDVVIATDDERIRGGRRGISRPRGHDARRSRLRNRPRRRGRLGLARARSSSTSRATSRMIDPAAIDAAVLGLLDDDEHVPMGTLKKRIERPADIDDPNVVKVVTDHARQRDLFLALAHSLYARTATGNDGRLFQAHRAVRLPPRFPAGLSGSAGGTARTRRAPGAVARARKRIQDSRGGNGVRIAGRRYARRLETGFGAIRKTWCLRIHDAVGLQRDEITWPNTYL